VGLVGVALAFWVRSRVSPVSKPKDPPSNGDKDDPPPTPRSGSVPPISLACVAFVLFACSAPQEKTPCSPADYAALAATCGDDEAECSHQIDERERLCAERIRSDQ
jgi:hypothetical protein